MTARRGVLRQSLQDLRNHGDSPHDPVHTYTAMAMDVEAFITEQRLEGQKPALIGHSMGAKTAMTVALRRPDLVSAVVAVDNSPVVASLGRPFELYVQGMLEIEAARVRSQREADHILRQYEELKDISVRQFLLHNLCRDPETGIYTFRVPLDTLSHAIDAMAGFPFAAEDAGSVCFDGPALFVRGTRSTYMKDAHRPLISRFFPKYEMVDVDASHWLISERPQEFINAVTTFLRKPQA
ncbi:hypothetical protein KEM52_005244 [Ascosphaera acerosa]|nr:hypothetical protein KEM52_005244 [Ascosphaera acerosa]